MADGIALGGLANAARFAREASQKDRSLDIQEKLGMGQIATQRRGQDLQMERQRLEQIQQAETAVGGIIEAITEGRQKGVPVENLQALATRASQILKVIDVAGSKKTPGLSKALQQAINAPSAVVPMAQEEGKGKAASAVAQRDALTNAGVTSTAATEAANLSEPKTDDPLIVDLQKARATALAGGNKELADEIGAQIAKLGTIVGRTEQDVNLTKGALGKAQDRIASANEALGQLQNISRQLKDGTVGFGGFIRGIGNITAAQISPEFFDENRAKFEEAVKAGRQAMMRDISSENRFSETDRERIEDMFPSLGVFGNMEVARNKLDNLEAFMIRRLANRLKQTDATEGVLSGTTPDRIRDLHTRGFLSRDEAVEALTRMFPEQK